MNSFPCVSFSIIFSRFVERDIFVHFFTQKGKKEKKKKLQEQRDWREERCFPRRPSSRTFFLSRKGLCVMKTDPSPLAKATPSSRSLLLRPWGSLLCIVEFVHCSISLVHTYVLPGYTYTRRHKHICIRIRTDTHIYTVYVCIRTLIRITRYGRCGLPSCLSFSSRNV